ncbi:heterokaryon incompatibility protein-domain-containing protein [Coniochaeta sp. 2T2.1]|nr:heterokaryon incompatibility protein-domain-containing protein [Coniochaeta sp. 2T2.1]
MSLYRPLSTTQHEIRLLHLHPSPTFSSPLICTLTHTSLSPSSSTSPTPYEALTYFWGEDKSDVRPIILNDQPLTITANLDLALRHLRLPSTPRVLWVDALCINQSDVAERSHQVSLMRDVYSRCVRDVAWLGPLSDDREEFIPEYLSGGKGEPRVKYVDHVGEGMELIKRMRYRDLADPSLAGNPGEEKMSKGEEHHELEYRQVDSLRAVFERPKVWSRVWVMQELSCARNVTLVYANHELDWGVVSGFLGEQEYADAFHMSESHGSTRPVTRGVMSAVLAVEHQRGIVREGVGASLLDVLARFKNVFSTDPRDRVYGLLGLVTERHGIRVDYRKASTDVFGEVAVYLVNSLGNLDIICQNPWAKDGGTEGLASWVPDFADREYSGRDSQTGFARLLFAQRRIFRAGREKCETPVRTLVHEGRWKIRATGAAIGKLGRVLHEECHGGDKSGDYYRSMHIAREWMLLYFGTDLLDDKESERREAYWRTLVMDCEAYPIRRLDDEAVEEIRPDWEFYLRYDGPEDPKQAKGETRERLENQWRYCKGTQMWYRNREGWTFCLSEEGRYLMVRRGAREGDIIAVLDGGKVPVILRELPREGDRETEYQVVCVAYVHGFMDGQAVKMCEAGELTERDFLLA